MDNLNTENSTVVFIAYKGDMITAYPAELIFDIERQEVRINGGKRDYIIGMRNVINIEYSSAINSWMININCPLYVGREQ